MAEQPVNTKPVQAIDQTEFDKLVAKNTKELTALANAIGNKGLKLK
jgi:hypothetical protein